MQRNPLDIIRFSLYFARIGPTIVSEKIRHSLFGTRKQKLISLSPSAIDPLWPTLSNDPRIAEEGAKIVSTGQLEILGRRLSMGWPPRWETEETGEWPKGHSSSISYYGPGVDNDIKLIWELNRLQWLPSVAYLASKNEDKKLASEVLETICDYVEKHPRGTTVAWIEGIEVSLRAISIVECCSQIGHLIGHDDRFRLVHSSLSEHADWISKHLSDKWRVNNNHILIELVGLLVLGLRLDWHPNSERWISIASKKLSREMESQISSGRNWEPTTAYHRFVTEAILVALKHSKTGEKNPLSENIWNTASEMVDTIRILSDESEKMPLIGDDDAGIVLPRYSGFDARDNSRILLFSSELGLQENSAEDGVFYWEDQGMGVIRDDDIVLNFVAGAPPGNRRQGSHRHLDMLSVCLSLNGEEIILDGGTGAYFGNEELRNNLRSELSHSGVRSKISGWAKVGGLFEIRNPPEGKFERMGSGARISCPHPSGGIPVREIQTHEGEVVISDFLDLEEPVISFLLPKGGHLSQLDEGISIDFAGWRLLHSPSPSNYSFTSDNCFRSTGYGIFEDSDRIEFEYTRGSVSETRIQLIHD